MKLLQVVPSYWPAILYGGPIFSIHAASQALAERGVEVRASTTNANGNEKLNVPTNKPVELAENYHVHYYNDTIINRFSWAFTRNLWGDIKASDIVHLQDIFSAHAALCLICTALQKKPLLISPRGVFAKWALDGKRSLLKKIWLNMFVKPFVRNPKRVAWHVTAPQEGEEVTQILPDARIYTIPNGINLLELKSGDTLDRTAWLAKYFPDCKVAAQKTINLVSLGRLHAKKSFDIVISALAELAEKHSELVLVIAGPDDGEKDKLEKMIVASGLSGRARLCGLLDRQARAEFLKGADIFLFPSHNENFGMVAVEALACHIPVIASRNTPWQQLEECGAGYWVDNTSQAFAEGIERLLDSGSLENFRQAAGKLAAEYDFSNVAKLLEETYAEMLEGQAGDE